VDYDSLLGFDPTFLSALQRIPAIPDESAGEWGQKMGVRVVFVPGPGVLAVHAGRPCNRKWPYAAASN
jgi:hypothetical protein